MTTATASRTVIDMLNVNVASTLDLYSQIKQSHWNVVGAEFIALHELFDAQASTVAEMLDTFAERLRALDAVPAGTVSRAAEATQLPPMRVALLPASEAVAALLVRFQQFGATLKQSAVDAGEAGDIATEDMYVEALREVDKQAWFLRAHLA